MANIVKLSDKSKSYIGFLLRKEFDKIELSFTNCPHKLIIEVVKELGLTEVAEEMESDLKIYSE